VKDCVLLRTGICGLEKHTNTNKQAKYTHKKVDVVINLGHNSYTFPYVNN